VKNHGGKREGAGRKPGPSSGRVKMGISISSKNAEWLKEQKAKGRSISRLIDMALCLFRGSDNHGG
jgi:hypothetical protein